MKHRILSAVLPVAFFALIAVVVPPQPGYAAQPHVVPYGTPVIAVLEYPLSSAQLQNGDLIPVRVARDVVVDGCVVIRRGARGVAEVLVSSPASEGRMPGSLLLQLKWVRGVDHRRVAVDGFLSERGHDRQIAVWADAAMQGSNMAGVAGAEGMQVALGAAGGVLETVAGSEKGTEAVAGGDVFRGKIANMWGVTIESDIPAEPEDAQAR